MAGQNKATMRRKLQSAFAHKGAADTVLDALLLTQQKYNAALTKLDGDSTTASAAVAATASITSGLASLQFTSVATGTARNGTTFTLKINAAAANPTNTILAAFTGTAGAIRLEITPNDGTNNSATPVTITYAQLATLINTGAVGGKTITLTDASSLRALQTCVAAVGGAFDVDPGSDIVGTFANGAAANAGLDVNYVTACGISSPFEADAVAVGQSKASVRTIVRSCLTHRALADELLDCLEEFQAAHNAVMEKLDDEAGTLNDTDYADLAVAVLDPDAPLSGQHKSSMRKALRSAFANASLADDMLDAIVELQESFNAALDLLDAGTITSMSDLVVTEISPD